MKSRDTAGVVRAVAAALRVGQGGERPLLFAGLAVIPLGDDVATAGLDISEADFERFARAVYTSILELTLVLGAVMLVNALISTDREKQHLRFLFSRPVVPWQYYLQHFVLSLGLFVACFSLRAHSGSACSLSRSR